MHVKFIIPYNNKVVLRTLRHRIEDWLRLHNVAGAWLVNVSESILALVFTHEEDCSMFALSWTDFTEVKWIVSK